MTRRGDETRQQLLDTAERLLGERGFHAVSLREIRIAAGARNTAAMQFHFGDREGLVRALMDRHLPRIGERQAELYERLVTDGETEDERRLVEVLVRPGAEYLTRGPGERSWVKIMAELSSLPDLRGSQMQAAAPSTAVAVGAVLYERLCTTVPPLIARRRMVLVAQTAVQLSAVRARAEDGEDAARALPMDVFVENLVDMCHAALFGPMSDATARTLDPPTVAPVTPGS